MNTVTGMTVFSFFAGPKEELDKLEAVNWSLVSSDSDNALHEFLYATRNSENSLTLHYIEHLD